MVRVSVSPEHISVHSTIAASPPLPPCLARPATLGSSVLFSCECSPTRLTRPDRDQRNRLVVNEEERHPDSLKEENPAHQQRNLILLRGSHATLLVFVSGEPLTSPSSSFYLIIFR